MDVRELQFGDLVNLTNRNGERMEGVHMDAVLMHEAFWNFYKEEPFVTFEPIPLTPEILKKNGFIEGEIERKEFSDVGLRYTYETQGGSYLIIDWQDSFDNGCGGELRQVQKELWIITVFGCNGLFESTPHGRAYVHELQRALRCCGLWDLANNFKV